MFRSPLVIAAVPAGLAAGFLAWFAAGGPDEAPVQLAAAARALAAVHPLRPDSWLAAAPDVTELAAAPLFVLTTGPAAVPEPLIRVDGLARAGAQAAALLSIDGRPADWLHVGEARDGVTLERVEAGRVRVDTVYGPRVVDLGAVAGAPEPAAATASPSAAMLDAPPPGFRAPPPPASAPRAR